MMKPMSEWLQDIGLEFGAVGVVAKHSETTPKDARSLLILSRCRDNIACLLTWLLRYSSFIRMLRIVFKQL